MTKPELLQKITGIATSRNLALLAFGDIPSSIKSDMASLNEALQQADQNQERIQELESNILLHTTVIEYRRLACQYIQQVYDFVVEPLDMARFTNESIDVTDQFPLTLNYLSVIQVIDQLFQDLNIPELGVILDKKIYLTFYKTLFQVTANQQTPLEVRVKSVLLGRPTPNSAAITASLKGQSSSAELRAGVDHDRKHIQTKTAGGAIPVARESSGIRITAFGDKMKLFNEYIVPNLSELDQALFTVIAIAALHAQAIGE